MYFGELRNFVRVQDASKCFDAGLDSTVIRPKSIVYEQKGAVYEPDRNQAFVPNKKYPVFYFDSNRE